MKKHLFGLVKLGVFMLGFAALVWFANLHFIQTDTFAALTMQEMKQREDIVLAFVGSSIVRDHFNVDIITKETGMTAFDVAIPCASMPATIAVTKELYRTSIPEWTVMVAEPYNFDTVREGVEAQFKMMPFLTDPANILDYYLRLCDADGYYLDRLFLFRKFGAQSPRDILKTIGLRYWPEKTYELLRPTLDPSLVYNGGGFLRHDTDERADELIRNSVFREFTGYKYDLFPQSVEQIKLYKQQVEAAGSKLMVMIFPNHTAHGLAEPGFLDYNEGLRNLCAELGVPCYDFTLARPELMPVLDEYYYDLYHMVGEGADIFTRAMCRVFNAHLAGEDVSHLFYADNREYLMSIDFITNAWVLKYPGGTWDLSWSQDQKTVEALAADHDVFMANSNRGPSLAPEYKFVIREEDGSETLLQDYGVAIYYACEKGALDGKTLRVYGRVPNVENAEEHWYDLPVAAE